MVLNAQKHIFNPKILAHFFSFYLENLSENFIPSNFGNIFLHNLFLVWSGVFEYNLNAFFISKFRRKKSSHEICLFLYEIFLNPKFWHIFCLISIFNRTQIFYPQKPVCPSKNFDTI